MGSYTKFSDIGSASIQKLLTGEVNLQVPKFQRNYAWNTEKVDTLWNDFIENFKLIDKQDKHEVKEAHYILGPVVMVKKEEDEYDVIDGQQRLATLTMLFCISRDIMLEHDKNGRRASEGICLISALTENMHLGKHRSWKLRLNDSDKELFEKLQTRNNKKLKDQIEYFLKESKKCTKPSMKLLMKNYDILYYHIMYSLTNNFTNDEFNKDEFKKTMYDDESIQKRIENIPTLNLFLRYIIECNHVIKVIVKDDNTAFQIFETLNERGQTLSKSNLIKNHVLNKVDQKNKEALTNLSNKWNNIFDDIIGQGQRDDDFIMDSLRSRPLAYEGKVSHKNLYKIIKEKVSNEKDAKEYIKNLEEDAKFVSTLNDPAQYTDKHTVEYVRAMNALGAKVIRIPIIAAWRKYEIGSEYSKLIKLLVKFFFKYKTIRNQHHGFLEKIIINATKCINNGDDVDSIINKIKENDNHENFLYQFENDFMQKQKKDIVKYVLNNITVYLADKNTDVRPIDNLTLEHILPQKFEKWDKKAFFEEDDVSDAQMEKFVHRLGNLTLLRNAVNSKIQNEPFSKKINEYKKSELKINTKTVCNQTKWTKKIIKERELLFTKYANVIWNLKDTAN